MFADNLPYLIGQDAIAVVLVGTGIAAIVGYGIRQFWKRVDARLKTLDDNSTANGKTSLSLGDTAARIEDKVDHLGDMLLAHLAYHPGPSPSGPLPPSYIANDPERKPTRAQIEEAIEEATGA